jgi:hypothetical protein
MRRILSPHITNGWVAGISNEAGLFFRDGADAAEGETGALARLIRT